MLSTPTTSAISVFPSMMLWLAISSTARIPEAQFWFTLTGRTAEGKAGPASDTCLAGSDPCIPVKIWPMTISSITSPGMPALEMASFATATAKSLAATSF